MAQLPKPENRMSGGAYMKTLMFFTEDPGWYDMDFLEEELQYSPNTLRKVLNHLYREGRLIRRPGGFGSYEYNLALKDTKPPVYKERKVGNGKGHRYYRKTKDYVVCQYSKCFNLLPPRPPGKPGMPQKYCSGLCRSRANAERYGMSG